MSCKIGDQVVRVGDVKAGKDVSGSYIDTQIIFFCNRDKIVLHCYNTTQLILVNGHGYVGFINLFLKPFFESKIQSNEVECERMNQKFLESLGSKKSKETLLDFMGLRHIFGVKNAILLVKAEMLYRNTRNCLTLP